MKLSNDNPISAAFVNWVLTLLAAMLLLHLVLRYQVELSSLIDWSVTIIKSLVTSFVNSIFVVEK